MSHQLKTSNTQLEAEDSKVRNAELEADLRNAQLAELAELAELKEKLKHKDQFILDYWEMMKNQLITEKKINKELASINTELKASNTELNASNTELKASNTKLKIELDWYHKLYTRERSCATDLTAVSW
jgi:hypothetical protein